MWVEVRLSASLRRYLSASERPGRGRVAWRNGMCVRDLIEILGIPHERDHEGGINLIMINDQQGKLDTPLRAGDRVSIFPPLSGGNLDE